MSDEKSYKIQQLRGMAIIAVVFIHNTPFGLAQVFCRPFINFSVGLFLFLSGMLSCADRWNPVKRINKVLIPYVLWTLIYTIIYNYKTVSLIPIIYVKYLITGSGAAIMYYIFVYCEFTLIIPFIDKLAKSRYRYLGFLISPIEIICMRLIPVIAGCEMNKYVNIIVQVSCLGWFTYYYLGYLLGNKLIHIRISSCMLSTCWCVAVILQMAEGYLYLLMGESNCGTQLKLTSVLTGVIIAIFAYKFIGNDKNYNCKVLKLLGDNSFGIYFSHLAVMSVTEKVFGYLSCYIFPVNAVVVTIISCICVNIGKRILGKHAKYLAL